ncbi:hypothetical protein Tco_1335510 [Tanacetum coccineum]
MSFLSTNITSYGYWLWVVSSGWSFVYAILGQMTYSVASPTLDSAGSYVMQGAPFTQGTIPSIPIGGSISLEGFLPSILLVVLVRWNLKDLPDLFGDRALAFLNDLYEIEILKSAKETLSFCARIASLKFWII